MAELRWLLLLFGIGVIVAIYFYTRYKPQIDAKLRRADTRREPRLDIETLSEPAEPVGPASPEPDESSSPSDLEEPRPAPRKVVAIRLMARDMSGFPADELILQLRELGLRHGQFGIFHRHVDSTGQDTGEASVFSVASLVEPGSFDLTNLKNSRYPGISVFMTLPGPKPGVAAFDDMMDFSRALVQKIDGYLLDEQGGTLSVQRERYMREEIIQFEHRGTD